MNKDSSPAKLRLREKLRGATATAILEAGEAVFAQQGLHTARMDTIAEHAGVAVGTLYNYFADRDAIVTALIDMRRAELLGRLDQSLETTASLPFRQQLEGFVMAVFQHMKSHKSFLAILMEAENANIASAKPKQAIRALLDRCERIVSRGVKSGALKDEADIDYAAMLQGVVRAAFTQGRHFGKPVIPSRERAVALVDFFLGGAGKAP